MSPLRVKSPSGSPKQCENKVIKKDPYTLDLRN